MSIITENTVKLRDGRTLGYAEYGDPNEGHVSLFTNHNEEILGAIVD